MARLMLARTRNGLPLGSVKTCDTSRSSHRLSATAVSSVVIPAPRYLLSENLVSASW
jgi:hypothetical protein